MSRWAGEHADDVVSSDLLRTELLRHNPPRRAGADASRAGRAGLDHPSQPSGRDLRTGCRARALAAQEPRRDPPCSSMRELGDELDGIVTYDDRLSDAAELLGVTVLSPS